MPLILLIFKAIVECGPQMGRQTEYSESAEGFDNGQGTKESSPKQPDARRNAGRIPSAMLQFHF
jgi:hypothetical protein